MSGDIVLSPVGYDDLPGLAACHVHSWKESYPGIIDQKVLDELSIEQRLQRWQEIFNKHKDNPKRGAWVAIDAGETVGFSSYGPTRDEDRSGYGEVYAVYVRKSHWGSGVGHRLFTAALENLKQHGFNNAFLWVIDKNMRAQHAYTRWGGKIAEGKIKQEQIGETNAREVRFVFEL